jgi:predicted nucleic acid-binding protein
VEIDRSIVLDANILMRAVLCKKVRQIITEHAEHVALYIPQIAYDDARRHLYESKRSAALARIETRDSDDWPILAVALVLDCAVWTEDNHFFGTGVPTWAVSC